MLLSKRISWCVPNRSKDLKVIPKATVRNASGVSNGHRINIEKFTSYLQGITRNTSTQKCARSIRVGLQSSGAKIVNHPVAAADWGSTLMQLGYKKINASLIGRKRRYLYY